MVPALINPSRSADHKLRKEWVSCFLDFLFFVGGDPCALSHLYCWTCWVLSLVSPTPPLCKTGRVTTVLRPTHETSSIRTGFYYSNSDIIIMWFNEGQKDLLCILFPLAKAFVFYVTIKAIGPNRGQNCAVEAGTCYREACGPTKNWFQLSKDSFLLLSLQDHLPFHHLLFLIHTIPKNYSLQNSFFSSLTKPLLKKRTKIWILFL